jgi:hypothetical protein
VTKQLICYIGGQHEYQVLKHLREAVVEYGKGRGWGTLSSEQYHEEVVPGDVLQQAMSLAGDGAVFVVNSLQALGIKPSDQRARILALLGRNVDVHVLGLGSISECLAVLRAAWDAAAPLEARLAELEREFDAHEAELNARMASFEDRLVSRMSEVMGHGAVKAFYGVNGGSHPEPVTDPTALHVRALREAKGWSQQQLADAAGVSKSQVQRLESVGKSTDQSKIVSALEHQGWTPDVDSTKWVEGSQ